MMRTIAKSGLALALLLSAGPPALAQSESPEAYPSRPIRFIVPFLPGGTSEGITRFIGQHLTEKWKQPVLIDARPGAGGSIGAAEAAKARPDGYTLVLLVTGHMILPAIMKSVPYSILGDFTPVTIISRSPKLVVTGAASPVNSFAELLARVRQDPALANYGTSGIGSEAHLSMELVNLLAGTKFNHVPYKGGVGPLNDLIDNRLPVGFLDIGSVLTQVKAGKLKVLAIASATRSPLMPDVPRINEVLPEFETTGWYGIAGPRGMAPGIVQKLEQEIRVALRTPAAKTRFTDTQGWELPATTARQMEQEMTTQTKKWAELVQRVGVKEE